MACGRSGSGCSSSLRTGAAGDPPPPVLARRRPRHRVSGRIGCGGQRHGDVGTGLSTVQRSGGRQRRLDDPAARLTPAAAPRRLPCRAQRLLDAVLRPEGLRANDGHRSARRLPVGRSRRRMQFGGARRGHARIMDRLRLSWRHGRWAPRRYRGTGRAIQKGKQAAPDPRIPCFLRGGSGRRRRVDAGVVHRLHRDGEPERASHRKRRPVLQPI